jgi:hypothetical protein
MLSTSTLDAVGHAVNGLTHRRIIVACNENDSVASAVQNWNISRFDCESGLLESENREVNGAGQSSAAQHTLYTEFGSAHLTGLAPFALPRKAARLVVRQYSTFLNLQIGR